MPKRNKNKNKRKGRNLESSTPSSTPPSENYDDTRELLQGGACGGSSKSHKSASTEHPKGDEKRPASEEQSICPNLGAISLREQSGNSPCKEHLDVPEQASGISTSPSKTALNKLKGLFSQRKPQSHSPTPECGGEDDSNQGSDRPELKTPPADAPKSVSPFPLTKKDSSSSSGRSFKESPRSYHKHAPEMHHLAVPGQERDVSPKSPTKRSFFQHVKDRLSPKKKSPVRLECSCTDKSKHGTDCPEWERGISPNRSGPSSNASPSPRRRQCSEDSNATSGSSQLSASKISSTSVPSSKDSPGPNRSILTSGYSSGDTSPSRRDSLAPPRDPTDYDPGEGTSRGPAVREGRNSGKFESPFRGMLRSLRRGNQGDDSTRLIKMDFEDSEDEERNPPVVRRHRSKSFGPRYSYRSRRQRPENAPSMENICRELRADREVFHRRVGSFPPESPEERQEIDEELVRRSAETSTTSTERRHLSASQYPLVRCECNHPYLHGITCSREIIARRRRKKRRCKQDVFNF